MMVRRRDVSVVRLHDFTQERCSDISKVPNHNASSKSQIETPSEDGVVGLHHVSELRCRDPLLVRLDDVLKLRCHDIQLVGFI